MLKKIATILILLHAISLYAGVTGVELHLKYGTVMVDEDFIMMEDNSIITLC